MDTNQDQNGGITIHGTNINNLRFADDTGLLEHCSDKQYSCSVNKGSGHV